MRARRGLPSLPHIARLSHCNPCSPSLVPLGSQRNCRLLTYRQGIAMISGPLWVRPAVFRTGENQKEYFFLLPSPLHPSSLGKTHRSVEWGLGGSAVWPSFCVLHLVLFPVLTEGKVKQECLFFPCLGKADFLNAKSSKIQHGYDVMA